MLGVPQIVAGTLAQIDGLSQQDKYKALAEQPTRHRYCPADLV